jgi:hypothetical protein
MQLNINVIYLEISHSLLYSNLCFCFVVRFPIHMWVYEICGQCYWSPRVVLFCAFQAKHLLSLQRLCWHSNKGRQYFKGHSIMCLSFL